MTRERSSDILREMRALETTIKRSGRVYKQLERADTAAAYEVYGAHDSLIGYELIVVKIKPAEHLFGQDYPEREVYPSNEEWGQKAWSYPVNEQNIHGRLIKLIESLTPN